MFELSANQLNKLNIRNKTHLPDKIWLRSYANLTIIFQNSSSDWSTKEGKKERKKERKKEKKKKIARDLFLFKSKQQLLNTLARIYFEVQVIKFVEFDLK
jgi:hypothetical protein